MLGRGCPPWPVAVVGAVSLTIIKCLQKTDGVSECPKQVFPTILITGLCKDRVRQYLRPEPCFAASGVTAVLSPTISALSALAFVAVWKLSKHGRYQCNRTVIYRVLLLYV